jgi:hypothetical protein
MVLYDFVYGVRNTNRSFSIELDQESKAPGMKLNVTET